MRPARRRIRQENCDARTSCIEFNVGRTPISAKLSPHGPVFGVQSPAHRSDSGTFSTAEVFILALMGRTPWSARVPLDPLPQALTNTSSKPTWASAADQGVRPTLYSSIRDRSVFSTVRAPREIEQPLAKLGPASLPPPLSRV